MELKIYWTEFSEKELHRIFDYYKDKTNYRIAKKLVSGIINETYILKKHSKIGQIEELLIDREQEFRYLLHKNF